ncbi:lipopolysaccharide biosynthesis protein [Myroides odoratimimus]|uniref:lipopolysaccharide biosynthesis protein n=1 Tax=Myroides odoratimimus TaxID=76832 RepID=UPI003D2F1345
MKLLKSILQNKNICYLLTRYVTYGIQFLVSIYIAVALGPQYFGIWGFILLLINYFAVFDFGISNAVNLMIIQSGNDSKQVQRYFTTGFLLVTLLNFLIIMFFVVNYLFPMEVFVKYHITNKIWLICLIVVNVNYNNLMMHLYRINNKLAQISFYQSVVPILLLIVVSFFNGESLLMYLVLCYSVGNLLSFCSFVFGKVLPKFIKPVLADFKNVFRRGFFLFLFNVSFYLIVLSLRSFISAHYTVSEFGIFSFAFTLGNSILLLLQAISFLIYPKVVAVLNKLENDNVLESLNNLRRVYLTLTYLMLFIGLVVISKVIDFIPKYSDSFRIIGLCSLTMVLYSNSFGYGTYLISKGQERINALISILSLVVNISLCYILVNYVGVSFHLVICATMFAYVVYTFLTVYFTKKTINAQNRGLLSNFLDCFGINILIPYFICLVLVMLDYKDLVIIPLLIFILLSKKDLKFLWCKVKQMISNKDLLKI